LVAVVGLIKTVVIFNLTVAVLGVVGPGLRQHLLVLLLGVWLTKVTAVVTELIRVTAAEPVAGAVAGLVLLVLLARD
jgi:hypothetical protein